MDNNENSIQAIYTVPEFADKYRVHRSTVYRWLDSGVLKSFKIGKCRRITSQQEKDFTDLYLH